MNQSNANQVVNPTEPAKAPGNYHTLVQFASLAFMTQGVLLLNQILLLPIQIRVWGTDAAAYWYSTMAVAGLTAAADFGLRTAGHAEIIRCTQNPDDHESKKEFQHLWAWIRILITVTTIGLIAVDFAYHAFYRGASYPLWRPALVIGIALEAVITIRITYLDSQGLYRQAEAGYLVLAAGRLILALGALLIFNAPPSALAWIWFGTGIFTLVSQNRLCRRLGMMYLFEPIPPGLSFRMLATVRHTMADPCSGWVRLNGPVVILSAIAQPAAIVTYVALRAVFGAARTTILQLSRYASVEYLSLRQSRLLEEAETQLTLCVLGAAFFASGITAFVIADNGRLASLLLNKVDMQTYLEIAITFGLGSAFYCYQILQAVDRRTGEVGRIAHRQYFYMVIAAVFAVIALMTKWTLLWLVLMLVADVLLSLSFLLKTSEGDIQSQTSAGWRGSLSATANALIVLSMLLIVHLEKFDFLRGKTISDIACSVAFWLLWILLIAAVNVCLIYGLLSKNKKKSLLGLLLETLRSTGDAEP